jgi:hypothetical protein
VSINGVVYQAQPVGTPSGQFQVTWSPVVAGTYVMTALLNGVAVQQSGVYQVVVSGRSNPSADNTVYSGAGWTGAKSGSQTSFTVLLRDV